ncbi:MAG: glutaminyl-peptide cyclotransferase [Fimbriimonadales bacterium]
MKRHLGLMMGAVGLVWLFGCQAPDSSTTTAQPTPPSEPETAQDSPPKPASKPIPTYGYRVVNTYPHDREAFTQGLEYYNGWLYESTGLEGRSSLRKVELRTGRVLQIRRLSQEIFAEGITLFNSRIYQLTWKNGVAFVYDRDSFRNITEHRYTGEGWGLTHDGKHLIMSDGSDTLFFRDPDTFGVVRQLKVHANGAPVRNLNELEYIEGEIWANIWQTDMIARISPKTGEVVGWVDLEGLVNLLPERDRLYADVLNGIAYDKQNKRLFVTGKLWSRLFEIELVPADADSPVSKR